MKGSVVLRCSECGLRREVAGEIPEEYTASFSEATRSEGWVPRPGADGPLICGACLARFSGHETMDDQPKVLGLKDPTAL